MKISKIILLDIVINFYYRVFWILFNNNILDIVFVGLPCPPRPSHLAPHMIFNLIYFINIVFIPNFIFLLVNYLEIFFIVKNNFGSIILFLNI